MSSLTNLNEGDKEDKDSSYEANEVIHIKTKHYTGDVVLIRNHYCDNMRPVLCLFDSMTDELILTATVNLEATIPEGMVAIKDWSENEGVKDSLIQAGIIGDTEYTLPTGYVTASVHKLL